MFTTRPATAADAELIAEQRRQMFADSNQAPAESMDTMVENFILWVRPRLEDGTYLGWLVEEDGQDGQDGQVVAGAGLWLIDFPPHWMDPQPVRAYLLNFYVDPVLRGRGLAFGLLRFTLEEASVRAIRVVTLHASPLGKPLYERNGFKVTNEMMLRLD